MSSAVIRNRIIGHGQEAPDQLLANPANWRIHPKAQQAALAGVLDEVGWVQSVIVNQRTGHLVDGHMRVSLALRDGIASVPVAYVDLSPEEEALILATIDPISAMAVTDSDQLAALLADVSPSSADVQTMLDEMSVNSGVTAPDFSALSDLAPTGDERIVTMKFTITESQREVINRALDAAKESAKGGESPNDMGNRLHAICLEYGNR
jgi:hypothetical protein